MKAPLHLLLVLSLVLPAITVTLKHEKTFNSACSYQIKNADGKYLSVMKDLNVNVENYASSNPYSQWFKMDN